MNVLWVVNTIFPEVAKHFGMPEPVHGGWMYALAGDLSRNSNIKLGVVTVYNGKDFEVIDTGVIKYYLIPSSKRRSSVQNSDWQKVVHEFNPDLVHIHGTEYSYGMELMDTAPELKYLVSIQGLVSVYYRYYFAGINIKDILSNITFRDLVRRDTLFHAKEKFHRRGLTEIEYIKRAKIIIGRTDWDRSHVNAIRPDVPYYFCNESLREEFYSKRTWNIDQCKRHSIFLSQCTYPIKGLHQVLKAVAILIPEFPNIKIFIAGSNIIAADSWMQRIRLGGYGSYIKRMVSSLGLQNHIVFTGILDAKQMRDAQLRTHVFVCPSSIENSPNSLGEAQILGVPSVATYSGGIPSMVKDRDTALLYRFEEFEMLADILRKIFTNDEIASRLSLLGKKEAEIRHDKKKNLERMLLCYEQATLIK